MDKPYKTTQYKGLTLEIHQESDPINPRGEDNLGKMVCYHPQYTLGDKQAFLTHSGQYVSLDALVKAIEAEEGPIVWLPLYLYDHSGITISVRDFSKTIDPGSWDTSHIGLIYVSYASLRKAYGWKSVTKTRLATAKKYLEGEVETYDDYLTGNVYGYVVKGPNGDVLDSCWGFFGDPEKSGIIEEAKAGADSEIKHGSEQKITLTNGSWVINVIYDRVKRSGVVLSEGLPDKVSIKAVKSLVLAQVCVGIDASTPQYLEALTTVIKELK